MRTQAAILEAATQEFARHGLGGARVDSIAARAKTNKRMLYYYFGGKEDLFLRRARAGLRAHTPRGAEAAPDGPARRSKGVTQLVVFTWNYYLAHPEFMTLLNSENLHRAQHLKRSRKIRAMHSPLIATLIGGAGARARTRRVFRAGVDPVQLYVSIAALGYFYLSNNHTLSTIFGRDLATPRARRERLAHMTDVILGYLRPNIGEALTNAARADNN